MEILSGKNLTLQIGGRDIIRECSLTLSQEILGILGPSGAGKSSLLRILAGLVTPSSGELVFQGRPLQFSKRAQMRQLRRSIGLVFQVPPLLSSRTVLGNLSYPCEVSGTPFDTDFLEELLLLTGMSDYRDRYPSQLSGGQRQRVGVAQALIRKPSLLLLDEPTSALDRVAKEEVWTLLQTVYTRLQIPMIIVTHEIDLVRRLCDRVLVMDAGLIIEEQTIEHLFMRPQHPVTQRLVMQASHDSLPMGFVPKGKLLRLLFSGASAQRPILAEMIQKFSAEPNILVGWIDRLHSSSLGTLLVDMTGPEAPEAIAFLASRGVTIQELSP